MQISFDPANVAELDAVQALIASLRGDRPQFLRPIDGTLHDSKATDDPGDDEQVDPAAAFGAQSPEQAFPAVPAAPTAAPAIPVTAAPAGTPVHGTAPETPAGGPDNGPAAIPTASPSSDVELDGDGLPWDGRIHSGPADKRPKNADGTWRKKRGVDDETIATVTAELRQVMGAPASGNPPAAASPEPAPAAAPTPAPAAPPPTPAAAGMESGPAVASPAANVPTPPAPPVPAVPAAPTPPPAAPAADVPAASFADLMRKITARQTAGTLTVEATSEIAKSLGLTGVRDLINRPDLVAAFDQLLPEQAG